MVRAPAVTASWPWDTTRNSRTRCPSACSQRPAGRIKVSTDLAIRRSSRFGRAENNGVACNSSAVDRRVMGPPQASEDAYRLFAFEHACSRYVNVSYATGTGPYRSRADPTGPRAHALRRVIRRGDHQLDPRRGAGPTGVGCVPLHQQWSDAWGCLDEPGRHLGRDV